MRSSSPDQERNYLKDRRWQLTAPSASVGSVLNYDGGPDFDRPLPVGVAGVLPQPRVLHAIFKGAGRAQNKALVTSTTYSRSFVDFAGQHALRAPRPTENPNAPFSTVDIPYPPTSLHHNDFVTPQEAEVASYDALFPVGVRPPLVHRKPKSPRAPSPPPEPPRPTYPKGLKGPSTRGISNLTSDAFTTALAEAHTAAANRSTAAAATLPHTLREQEEAAAAEEAAARIASERRAARDSARYEAAAAEAARRKEQALGRARVVAASTLPSAITLLRAGVTADNVDAYIDERARAMVPRMEEEDASMTGWFDGAAHVAAAGRNPLNSLEDPTLRGAVAASLLRRPDGRHIVREWQAAGGDDASGDDGDATSRGGGGNGGGSKAAQRKRGRKRVAPPQSLPPIDPTALRRGRLQPAGRSTIQRTRGELAARTGLNRHVVGLGRARR